jgi:hypothetical protein
MKTKLKQCEWGMKTKLKRCEWGMKTKLKRCEWGMKTKLKRYEDCRINRRVPFNIWANIEKTAVSGIINSY